MGKAREKELKKKLKKAKTAQEKSTASSTPTTTNNNEEVGNGEEDSSDVENDLPEQYIEEIVTERQFIDSDGQVKTEVTTTEQLKTKKKKKKRSNKDQTPQPPRDNTEIDTTHTEHIDVATGIQDSVIKKTLKQKIREKEDRMKKLRAVNN